MRRHGSRQLPASTEVSELTALLSAVSGGVDGKNGRRPLLDELISITRRTGATAHAGTVELGMLRQSLGHQNTARAAAEVLVSRAHADPAFSAALDTWRRKDRIREYLPAPTDEVPAGRAGWAKLRKSFLLPIWVWIVIAILTPSATIIVTDLTNAGAGAVRDYVNHSGDRPVKIESVTPLEDASSDTQALANEVQLSPQQLTQLAQFTSSGQPGLPPYLHAVPTQVASTEVTLFGSYNGTVTITDLQVVKKCQAPLTGTIFLSPAQGAANTVGLGFDLDQSTSKPQNVQRDDSFSGNFFQDHIITLAHGETQTLEIVATTHRYYCQFTFRMTVVTPNGTVTEYFGAAGQENSSAAGRPFELTSVAELAKPSMIGDFSSYRVLYVGGALTNGHDWLQENPGTYNGY